MKEIKYLKNVNDELKNDLKKDKYPKGGLVYCLDYSTEDEDIYRIGKTGDMEKRAHVYKTHLLHKKNVM